MESLFRVINLNSKDKIGTLKAEAHSAVKSTKYFPIYMHDGKEMIFKPLSKTKPLTTPFFAYSEVYWSYIINKYFDSRAPRYYLAISDEMEDEQPKYFNHGVLVESITPNNDKLINMYDYFIQNPDDTVNIGDYINYCMENYDYTNILLSDFISSNKERSEYLAYQILLSMLRQDQNFHYENINFSEKDLSLLPPIDFEFSTPFLYPDQEDKYEYEKNKYIKALSIKYEEDAISKLVKQVMLERGFEPYGTLTNNICLIVRTYPDVVLRFTKELDKLIEDLSDITINDPNNYIGLLNSDYWEVGHAFYKENDLDKYKSLKEKIELKSIDKDFVFDRISSDVLEFSQSFNLLLKTYLLGYYNGIENLEDLTIKQLLESLNIMEDVTIEDIDINTRKVKVKKMGE